MKPTPLGPDSHSELRSALLAHYDRSARDLPWRQDRDPYRVLVSEIMLQQTRVETVVGYYDAWLERFPSVHALAEADEDEVLKAWEGLGYYRRARNLHKAAKMLREGGDGFPSTPGALRELPGVGEYTAGAVASIAFQEVTPAVDGNVRRVLSRLYDEADPKPVWLRERAADLVDPERPGDWNQAVMELGATVCTPRTPRCDACPVVEWCAAHTAGTQRERPASKEARAIPAAVFVLAVMERDGRVLVERRPPDGLLAGLWAFPEARLTDDRRPNQVGAASMDVTVAVEEAVRIASRFGFGVRGRERVLEPVAHRFSHLDAKYVPVVLDAERTTPAELTTDGERTRWITADDADTALPVAQRRVLEAWSYAQSTTEVR